MLRPGAYRLKDKDGNLLTNAWNIEQLRHFYAQTLYFYILSISKTLYLPHLSDFLFPRLTRHARQWLHMAATRGLLPLGVHPRTRALFLSS